MAGSSAPPVFLTWTKLSVKIQCRTGQPRYLLHDVDGYAEPGNLDCIMGPSGSGKTTLLNALAGRLCSATVQSGQILSNGRRQKLAYGNSAYVTQDDALIPTLTVQETIAYSAHLELPNSMTRCEKLSRVQSVIKELGLQDCVNTKVGGWPVRGLSGGERKRVSIAIQILTHPQLLFLDEPTSGLDSAAACHVVKRLRTLALTGKTVLVSIHQPSAEVFALFDNLTLLSAGQTVYFGETAKAQQFFDDAGFPCPGFRNPCDHFLWLINSDFEEVQHNDVEGGKATSNMAMPKNAQLLLNAYLNSEVRKIGHGHIQHMSCKEGDLMKDTKRAAFFTQVFYLTSRSFTNMMRNFGYYWFRLFMSVILSICVATVFYNVGLTYSSIQARAGMLMFVATFMTFLGVVSFPAIMEDMKIFNQERLNGHYGVASFTISTGLSSLPFVFLLALFPGVILYFVSGLHSGFDHFFFFLLTLVACLSIVESLMMAIASMVSNYLIGLIAGSGVMGIFALTGGFYRSMNDLPSVIWRYPISYISFHTWANQAFYNNDFQGLLFESDVVGGMPLAGEDILREQYHMDIPYSKWRALCVLVGMAFAYRLIFVVSLKVRECVPYMINQAQHAHVVEKMSSGRLILPEELLEIKMCSSGEQ